MSDAALEVSDDCLTSVCGSMPVGEPAAEESSLSLRHVGDIPRGNGDVEGVGPGEGLGERVPITTARTSVQAKPFMWRYSSVSLSTTSSLVRCGTSRIRFTTCRKGGRKG